MHSFLEIFPPDVAEFLNSELDKFEEENDDPYTDNFRACKVGDPITEKLYEEASDMGCCGYADKEVEYQGDTYKIGFNYGH